MSKEFSSAKKISIPTDWTFRDPGVAAGFDDHVREQLPWYDVVTRAVAGIVTHYLPAGGLVYDIGASTGNVGRALVPLIETRKALLIPVEPSTDMAKLYDGPARKSLLMKAAEDVEYEPFDVAVLMLSLMFVPVADRPRLLATLRARCRRGGALVIVDKCLPPGGYVGQVFWRMTLDAKLAGGADPADVTRKEMSLRGVQRGLDPALLGPDAVEFFRFGEFAGWIIESPRVPDPGDGETVVGGPSGVPSTILDRAFDVV